MTDLEHTLHQLRKDLTNCQVRLSEAIRQLGALNLQPAEQHRCPRCNTPMRGPLSLAEHLHLSHDAPLPEHWLAAERLAGLTDA